MAKCFINLNIQAINLEYDDKADRDKDYSEIIKFLEKKRILSPGVGKSDKRLRGDEMKGKGR